MNVSKGFCVHERGLHMSNIEIGICVIFYILAILIYILRKRKWKKQQEFIELKGKQILKLNDMIPFVIIGILVLSFQLKSFTWIGFLCVIPVLFICVVVVINYNGVGDKGILHFSDQFLFEDIEVYYIGEINGKYVVDVKGKTSRLNNAKKKSHDMEVAELVIQKEDVEAIEALFAKYVNEERHTEYPIYKRIPA